MSEAAIPAGLRLNVLLTEAGLETLDALQTEHFEKYLSLLLRWNTRVNLTSIRDEEGILSRHFVESIACARALPDSIATLLDFGSGAGFPGIPIALCRPGILVTLAESQGKKAAFLQEAVRVLGISATVYPMRAQLLASRFDCVTLRAVDRMPEAVESAAQLVVDGGWLAVMTTATEVAKLQAAAGAEFSWRVGIRMPGGEERLLLLGERRINLLA